jgi:hypothetical protein
MDCLPVGERREWADVRPRPPPDATESVVEIARDPLLGDLMDYFWAAVAAGETRWGCGGQKGCARAASRACDEWVVPRLPRRPRQCAPAALPRSERVLALTGEIISDLNSSNYSVWEWRWRCVEVGWGGVGSESAFVFCFVFWGGGG